MTTITFTINNPVYCEVSPVSEVRPYFSYQKSFWKKKEYRKEQVLYPAFLIDKKGEFLLGLLPRLISWCKKYNLNYQVINNYKEKELKEKEKPELLNISFREDQERLIKAAKHNKRGVLKAPTGSGKTILSAGIISLFPEAKILFLCHTISLIKQTAEEYSRFNLGPISFVASGKKDLSGRIVIATMQSFKKLNFEDYCDKFDIIFVDEAHHCTSFNNTYAKILSTLITERKFGLTATLPEKEESKYALEGLIGPVIDEISLSEGINSEILARPRIKFVNVPINSLIQTREVTRYQDIYREGIINYRKRNNLVVKEIKAAAEEGKSSLVYVNQIEHGENILNAAERVGLNAYFIQGNTTAEERDFLRHQLHNKEIDTVIATTVWKEGINIKSLNNIILAGGGKSETALLQTIGRGFRRDNEKEEIIIIDFLDSGRYLSEHAIERLKIYVNYGWLS